MPSWRQPRVKYQFNLPHMLPLRGSICIGVDKRNLCIAPGLPPGQLRVEGRELRATWRSVRSCSASSSEAFVSASMIKSSRECTCVRNCGFQTFSFRCQIFLHLDFGFQISRFGLLVSVSRFRVSSSGFMVQAPGVKV